MATGVIDRVGTPADIFEEFPLRSSKVAIVGFATESMGDAPWDDQDCEIWILNMLHAHVPRWDRLWEMHDRACVEQETAELKRQTDHLGVLAAERARPIYTIEPWPDIPMSRRFPVELYREQFAGLCAKVTENPYYTSTFAFMIAAAVRGIVARRPMFSPPAEAEQITVAGVEMLNGEEYEYQRSCAEFWCGVALGHGIPLHIPARSALLESDGMYGYAHANATLELLSRQRAYFEDRRKQFRAQADQRQHEFNAARADWNTYDGARQALEAVAAEDALTRASDTSLREKIEAATRKRDEAGERRDRAHIERHLALGASQGVDWCVSHTTYLQRGGKV